jgi:hypothetical protein
MSLNSPPLGRWGPRASPVAGRRTRGGLTAYRETLLHLGSLGLENAPSGQSLTYGFSPRWTGTDVKRSSQVGTVVVAVGGGPDVSIAMQVSLTSGNARQRNRPNSWRGGL